MTRLWWVRHGLTHAREMLGWTDRPADLSDTERLARLSAALPQAPVVSSDLIRASATADAIAGTRLRLPHERDLREMHFGAWENRTPAALEAENPEVMRAFWETPDRVTPPGGESWEATSARAYAVAERLAAVHGDVILVAHFAVILTQVQRARGVRASEVLAERVDNLSITRLSFDGRWKVDFVNRCP